MKKQKNYPLYKVEPISTLRQMLKNRAEKDKDKIAFKFQENKQDIQKTYGEF